MGFALTALLAAFLLVQGSPARAEDATISRVRGLASAARSDPSALAELHRIDRIDGMPADLAAALAGAEGAELDRRLALLAASATERRIDPRAAREDARSILRGRKYRPAELPRPFVGPLRRMGDAIRRVADAAASRLPGGRATLWTILAALVVLLSLWVSGRVARRRVGVAGEEYEDAPGRESARRLEREAEAAERAGEFARAVRLRFRAGLLRLDERGVIDYHPGVRTRQVARAVHGMSFLPVARAFDEIAYGGRAASGDDAEAARAGWRRVLEETG